MPAAALVYIRTGEISGDHSFLERIDPINTSCRNGKAFHGCYWLRFEGREKRRRKASFALSIVLRCQFIVAVSDRLSARSGKLGPLCQIKVTEPLLELSIGFSAAVFCPPFTFVADARATFRMRHTADGDSIGRRESVRGRQFVPPFLRLIDVDRHGRDGGREANERTGHLRQSRYGQTILLSPFRLRSCSASAPPSSSC